MPTATAGTLRKAARRRGSRTSIANQPPMATPIKIATATMVGSVMTVTFDQPVSLNGTPNFIPNGVIANIVSAQQTGPMTVAMTFDGSVVGATSLNVGYRDPAIRNASGGFVTATDVALS